MPCRKKITQFQKVFIPYLIIKEQYLSPEQVYSIQLGLIPTKSKVSVFYLELKSEMKERWPFHSSPSASSPDHEHMGHAASGPLHLLFLLPTTLFPQYQDDLILHPCQILSLKLFLTTCNFCPARYQLCSLQKREET